MDPIIPFLLGLTAVSLLSQGYLVWRGEQKSRTIRQQEALIAEIRQFAKNRADDVIAQQRELVSAHNQKLQLTQENGQLEAAFLAERQTANRLRGVAFKQLTIMEDHEPRYAPAGAEFVARANGVFR